MKVIRKRLKYGFTLLLMLSSITSYAGSFESSQSALSKAYNDYYEALSKSPHPSKDAAALSKRILAPAQAGMRKAMKEQTAETLRRVRAEKMNSGKPMLRIPPNGKQKVADQADAPAAVPKSQAPERVPGPKTVLDGSKVPRELDFSSPKKADTSPADSAH